MRQSPIPSESRRVRQKAPPPHPQVPGLRTRATALWSRQGEVRARAPSPHVAPGPRMHERSRPLPRSPREISKPNRRPQRHPQHAARGTACPHRPAATRPPLRLVGRSPSPPRQRPTTAQMMPETRTSGAASPLMRAARGDEQGILLPTSACATGKGPLPVGASQATAVARGRSSGAARRQAGPKVLPQISARPVRGPRVKSWRSQPRSGAEGALEARGDRPYGAWPQTPRRPPNDQPRQRPHHHQDRPPHPSSDHGLFAHDRHRHDRSAPCPPDDPADSPLRLMSGTPHCRSLPGFDLPSNLPPVIDLDFVLQFVPELDLKPCS